MRDDDVGEALEVLDVERGPDVDAGREQLLARPASAWDARLSGALVWASSSTTISVGLALEGRVEVELGDRPAAIFDRGRRGRTSSPSSSAVGLGAPMGLDEADDDVDPVLLEASRARASIA